MRYLLLSVLLLFSVSLFAADGIMPDGWDIAAVEAVSTDNTEPILVPERLPRVAGGDHANATLADGKKTLHSQLICYRVQPLVMTAQLPWEVGWRQ